MSQYKLINENVITIKGVTFNKSYHILNSNNGLAATLALLVVISTKKKHLKMIVWVNKDVSKF